MWNVSRLSGKRTQASEDVSDIPDFEKAMQENAMKTCTLLDKNWVEIKDEPEGLIRESTA
jgi:hypothetical protein